LGTKPWSFYQLVPSLDGKFLFSSNNEGRVVAWSRKYLFGEDSQEHPSPLIKQHTGWISDLALSANGRILCTASHDKQERIICVWSTKDFSLHPLHFTKSLPLSISNKRIKLALSPDGHTVYVTVPSGKIEVWDISTFIKSITSPVQPDNPPTTPDNGSNEPDNGNSTSPNNQSDSTSNWGKRLLWGSASYCLFRPCFITSFVSVLHLNPRKAIRVASEPNLRAS